MQFKYRGIGSKQQKRTNSQNPKLGFEKLEARVVLSSQPVISEFLASNDDGLQDSDGDNSDWIEIFNPTTSVVDLSGWHLTDDADELDKWTFPTVSLDPSEYLVVFASNKDRTEGGGAELHTNFRLSVGGEYLALVQPDGITIASEFSPEYPSQTTDVSFGFAVDREVTTLISEGASARFLVPTDSSTNNFFQTNFDDSGFQVGLTGIGYETDLDTAEFASQIRSEVPSGTTTVLLRQTFNVTDPTAFEGLTLGLRYDDGFVAYLNGVRVAEDFAPAVVGFDSVATGGRLDSESLELRAFDLTEHLDMLVAGENVLAIQVLNASDTSTDLLLEPELTASTTSVNLSRQGFMVIPTPGEANILTGPIIESVTEGLPGQAANQNIVIETSVVENAGNGIARVDLHYRVNFNNETTVQVFDNGLNGDAVAGDGVYTGTIPSSAYSAGDLVRWYVTAEDNTGESSRAPIFADRTGQDQDAEYVGTIIVDPSVVTPLETLYFFTEDPNAAQTRSGARASLYFNGKFYDNVFVRRRGASSDFLNFPKQSFKFDFNGAIFEYADGVPPVEEINVNTTYTDKSFSRTIVAYELFEQAGGERSASFPLRVQQNGEFFSVAIFVEQVDEEYLERNGLDTDGALYKGGSQLDTVNGNDKVTREDENNSDLQALVDGVSPVNSDTSRELYLFDNVDIASVINYLAVQTIIHNNDHIAQNFYVYRDTEGTGEWKFLPWDVDLSLGRNFVLNQGSVRDNLLNDIIWADGSGIQAQLRFSHPFFGTQLRQKNDNLWNRLIDAVFETPSIQEQYLRRLRTLMDELLGAPGTNDSFIDTRLAELESQLAGDVLLDQARWGTPFGASQTLGEAINDITDDYLVRRRNHLYIDHSVNNPSFPGNAGIPNAQVPAPVLEIETIEFAPLGGPEQEYIQISNNSADAVDISGWTVSDGISHVFKPGTVIGSGSSLYLASNSVAFRGRVTGPSGGQGLFVQQWDEGTLSAFGETITIRRTDGSIAASESFVGDPSPEQMYLRISEINYNPNDALTQFGDSGVESGMFEFVELVNTSATETIDLAGVKFRDGIDFQFGETASMPVFSANFLLGSEGFVYSDNLFNGTNNPAFAGGAYLPTADPTGEGLLQVFLDDPTTVGNRGPASGGWSRQFSLAQEATVTVSLDFRMIMGHGFEADEFGEAILEINDIRLGNATNNSLIHTVGDGQTVVTPPVDSGWLSETFELQLSAGTHTLKVGGFNNKSTFRDEDVEFFFDNISVQMQVPVDLEPLLPGERVLVTRDQAAFESRYGTGLNVAGEFANDTRLSNSGERILLTDGKGEVILDFEYNDSGAWPGRADGTGSSLEVVDTAGEYNDPDNWRSSSEFGGSPGFEGAGPVRDVIVNEVLTNSQGGNLDLVELYNASGSAIDLNNWYVSDSNDDLLRYEFPSSTIIAAGQYLVLNEAELGFGFDGQSDSDVWLIEADAISGRPLRFADHVEPNATEVGVSLGLWSNGDPSGELFPMTSQTFGSANAGPLFGDVLISEVNYHPGEVPPAEVGNITEDELEFVELANISGGPVDISNWKVEGLDFTFPAGTILASEEAIVLVTFDPSTEPEKAIAFRNVFGIGAGPRLFGGASGQLNNAGERIELFRPEDPITLLTGDILVDAVRYDDVDPWPTSADGGGNSLQRTAANAYGNFADSWQAESSTPGSVNFVASSSGDFDGDGDVDGGDFLAWQRGFGTIGTAAPADGDANGDNNVDADDLAIWQVQFGGLSPLAVAVFDSHQPTTVEPEASHVNLRDLDALAGLPLTIDSRDEVMDDYDLSYASYVSDGGQVPELEIDALTANESQSAHDEAFAIIEGERDPLQSNWEGPAGDTFDELSSGS